MDCIDLWRASDISSFRSATRFSALESLKWNISVVVQLRRQGLDGRVVLKDEQVDRSVLLDLECIDPGLVLSPE